MKIRLGKIYKMQKRNEGISFLVFVFFCLLFYFFIFFFIKNKDILDMGKKYQEKDEGVVPTKYKNLISTSTIRVNLFLYFLVYQKLFDKCMQKVSYNFLEGYNI